MTSPLTVPVPKTWTDGEIPLYDEVQSELFDTLTWLANRPFVKVRQTSAQNVSSGGSGTAITWQYVDNDASGMFDSSHSTRITPTVPGWYLGAVTSGFQALGTGADSTGTRALYLQKNGTDISWARQVAPQASGAAVRLNLQFFVHMDGDTDYLESLIYQGSGSTMQTQNTQNSRQSQFFMCWFARY